MVHMKIRNIVSLKLVQVSQTFLSNDSSWTPQITWSVKLLSIFENMIVSTLRGIHRNSFDTFMNWNKVEHDKI